MLIKRTLMKRNQELADFEVDPVTGEVRVIDASEAGADLHASADLSRIIRRRAVSRRRADNQDVLASFGALSPIHLALMGHGLSLSDQYWYRAPGSADRWEDINFFDNEWDPGFGTAILKRDYTGLASCSPDVPDVTTSGQLIKAWEHNDDGICLIKESWRPDGADLQGVKLTTDLCALLFDEDCYVPVDIVERYGRPCSASPLMLARDEEFADGSQLYALTGMREGPDTDMGSAMKQESFQARIEDFAAVGIPDASAHVARMACLSCLALLANFHKENFGVIYNVASDARRAAPIFDYDGSFGFRDDDSEIANLCARPRIAAMLCASCFSFLDSSWDWTWYDPQVLEGFEDRIMEALAPYHSFPSNFSTLVANLFVMQRAYVNEITAGQV